MCTFYGTIIEWASNCVLKINNVYAINLLLPPNWKHIIMQSTSVSNQARVVRAIQPKAKAKAKAKVASILIGMIVIPNCLAHVT